MCILRLQLLNVKLVRLHNAFSDMSIKFNHGYFEFVNLISVKFNLTLQLGIELLKLVCLQLKFSETDNLFFKIINGCSTLF